MLAPRHQSLCKRVAAAEPAGQPAWPGPIRELGLAGERPPWKALIDWSLIFLTGWHTAIKAQRTRENGRGRVKKQALYDRVRDRAPLLVKRKEKRLCPCMSDDNDYCSNLGLHCEKHILWLCGNQHTVCNLKGRKKN